MKNARCGRIVKPQIRPHMLVGGKAASIAGDTARDPQGITSPSPIDAACLHGHIWCVHTAGMITTVLLQATHYETNYNLIDPFDIRRRI